MRCRHGYHHDGTHACDGCCQPGLNRSWVSLVWRYRHLVSVMPVDITSPRLLDAVTDPDFPEPGMA